PSSSLFPYTTLFRSVYGMEILRSDGIKASVIRAGNDNLYRSDIFSNTVATLIGQEIEIYNTTGAIGAARACVLVNGDYEAYGKQDRKSTRLNSSHVK